MFVFLDTLTPIFFKMGGILIPHLKKKGFLSDIVVTSREVLYILIESGFA